MVVGQELSDDSRLRNDFILNGTSSVFDGGDKTARIDIEIPLRARSIEVNRYFLEREVELFESDRCSVCPWAATVVVVCD